MFFCSDPNKPTMKEETVLKTKQSQNEKNELKQVNLFQHKKKLEKETEWLQRSRNPKSQGPKKLNRNVVHC